MNQTKFAWHKKVAIPGRQAFLLAITALVAMLLVSARQATAADDLNREVGQTVTEYAVTLGVLIVGIAGVLIVLRTGINTFLNKVGAALSALIP